MVEACGGDKNSALIKDNKSGSIVAKDTRGKDGKIVEREAKDEIFAEDKDTEGEDGRIVVDGIDETRNGVGTIGGLGEKYILGT